MLLRHLESTFDEQDIAFKGMYNILKSFDRQRRPLGNGKIDEISKISDSTYSFSSDGTMSYNVSFKHRNSLLNV
jgi:hypothetical protein